ncbi:MAG: helix-turn-helix transcriptional regulator [Ktedonobacterales bacterium]
MASARWYRRFFASTRGQVLTLLRRGAGTVDDVARALGLSDNAVRAHLGALERDGLVRQSGVVRGSVGKPAYAYTLTEEAEHLFPKPYDTVLGLLLDVVTERMSRSEQEAALREVGHRLARGMPPADGTPRTHLLAAVEALNRLGGCAVLEEQGGAVAIRGSSCPLASVVADHPGACLLAATLVSDITGVLFEARCAPGEPPRCRFERAGQ